MRTIDVAARSSASAVAVNVTGVVTPLAVAVTVFVPAAYEPRVSVDWARPFEPVVTEDADSVPPPAVTQSVTVLVAHLNNERVIEGGANCIRLVVARYACRYSTANHYS